MRATLDSIISASSEALRPLIEEAFELGRDAGRSEASAEMKAKLADLLSDNHRATPPVAASAVVSPIAPATRAADTSDKRAKPGSVRPAIMQMIADTDAGVTSEEIVKATGFKPNSVRGTLWTLGHEGLAVKRGNRWYSPPRGDDGIPPEGGVAEAVGASAKYGSML